MSLTRGICRFEFAANEFINCVVSVPLETVSTESGMKDFIAVGTTINRGEDLAVKGAVSAIRRMRDVPGLTRHVHAILGVHLRDRRGGARPKHEHQALVEAQAAVPRRREGPRNLPVWHERLPRLVHGAEGTYTP